ncbi:hypothetical protein CTI12_AA006200 [Artemisia annua]|uniref:COI1 F-box domain-containing protein n=1 Tax=Artemisia annua TaxID=35608 RepID=A0A2U1QNI2_ARTAN|nr:hypothetical protein CTI12_AA006200 [Artemisia annua]
MEKRLNVSIDTVFNCVIPYIHDGDDRNSVSLVCRKWCELEGVTRKHVTVHLFYSPKPSRLHQRFPLLESLTLKGLSRWSLKKLSIDITPWIHEISVSFKCLKSLCIRCMVVGDLDLELLARTRGKDLRVLKMIYCEGLSTDGLLHIGKCCNDLRTLCLKGHWVHEKDGKWLHELALQNTGIESLEFSNIKKYDVKDLTLLAKNCSQSLVSLKLCRSSRCALIDLVDVFRYVVRLEDFVGGGWDKNEGYGGFKFPPTIRRMSVTNKTSLPLVLPLAHQLRELYLDHLLMDADSRCFLIQRCPNLEILHIGCELGDMGLKLLGQFCKKLRCYKTFGFVSHIGLIALAQGCLALECLHVNLTHITIEAMKCIGTHLKNLHDFRLTYKHGYTSLPLDNGILAVLIGCGKLERLGICGLTDVGLGYIGKYGHNLRYLSLQYAGESDAGLMELSKGCPKLRKLFIYNCPFSKQAIVTIVFNMHSLRYMKVSGITGIKKFEMTRPNYEPRLVNGDA